MRARPDPSSLSEGAGLQTKAQYAILFAKHKHNGQMAQVYPAPVIGHKAADPHPCH